MWCNWEATGPTDVFLCYDLIKFHGKPTLIVYASCVAFGYPTTIRFLTIFFFFFFLSCVTFFPLLLHPPLNLMGGFHGVTDNQRVLGYRTSFVYVFFFFLFTWLSGGKRGRRRQGRIYLNYMREHLLGWPLKQNRAFHNHRTMALRCHNLK